MVQLKDGGFKINQTIDLLNLFFLINSSCF